ncbi:ferritin-like domain-containing protein [Pontibacter diazotrophicus]|uniref:Ferritin-like domain-containing protein n=1 Tax=Pontibacter diazotrophicus TaxID=1400979 RepID=A0A3D8LCE8_9BACT|nr:ferritin-like domain-containing protein [Pontibacter diazotrophicus]RDV15023.1 ferritin-like domain-containing protein [Pontibacter diazotrophicus]
MIKFTSFKGKDYKPDERLGKSRRSFLQYSGAALATSAILLSGCEVLEEYIPPKNPNSPKKVNLGSGDIGILNYAYALEQLEAAFYTKVALLGFYIGASPEEIRVLEDLRQHEVAHREFYEAALGKNAIGKLEFDFSMVDFRDRNSVLQTAKTFEDLGVAAYNGAGPLLENPDFLVVAGKIVSVEARHATAIYDLIDPSAAFVDFIDDGLERAFLPMQVLQMAAPFIVTEIDASNLPTA